MFKNVYFVICIYLVITVTFGQTYKILTNKMKNGGALTILAELLSGVMCLLFVPLFEFKFPSNKWVYLFLSLACIFYALNDRITTTVRSGLEASTVSMIKQVKTVLMILAGLIIFKDPVVWNKILGAFLIVFANFLVFYKKGSLKRNRYVNLGILSCICLTIALLIDVNYSDEFNLPLYVSFTALVPALFIFIFDKVKIKDLVDEYKNSNKLLLFIVGITWSIMMILGLYVYWLGNVSVIAPLCSLTVILNVVIGYLFLNEKDNLVKKLIAATLIIISVILIKM